MTFDLDGPCPYWVLDKNHRPVPARTYREYLDWNTNNGPDAKRVASTNTANHWVSTVFLCHDHNYFGEGPPILFETTVFKGDGSGLDHDEEMHRYVSWDDAVTGHAATVRRILKAEEMEK